MTFAFNLFRPVIAANLVDKNTMAYWPFDENSGKITKDSTANGIVGQIEKAEWAKGFSGSALKFDGFKESRNTSKTIVLFVSCNLMMIG